MKVNNLTINNLTEHMQNFKEKKMFERLRNRIKVMLLGRTYTVRFDISGGSIIGINRIIDGHPYHDYSDRDSYMDRLFVEAMNNARSLAEKSRATTMYELKSVRKGILRRVTHSPN